MTLAPTCHISTFDFRDGRRCWQTAGPVSGRHLPETSRARVQQLISQDLVLVNDSVAKASLRLRGGERIAVLATAQPAASARHGGRHSARYRLRRRRPGSGQQAGGHDGARRSGSDRRPAQSRHAGECAAASLRPAIVRRRRVAPGNRASSGQGHQRTDCGGQERRIASPAGQPVRPAASQEKVHRPGARLAEAGSRNHQQQHQPRPGAAHSHDHPATRAGAKPSPITRCSAGWIRRTENSPCWKCRSIPGEPTRFASTWPRLDIRLWETCCMALAASFAILPRKTHSFCLPRNFLHAAALTVSASADRRAVIFFASRCRAELEDFLHKVGGQRDDAEGLV